MEAAKDHVIENKEASWDVLGITVNATITAPKGIEDGDAVVFIAGSGPTDRNWCSQLLKGENGSAELLAEKLASQGFITIRYDKIAVNPHIKEHLSRIAGKISMHSHLGELTGAVDAITSQFKVNKLFALANSEGCIHAINYQLETMQNPFDGIVLTGVPGRPIGKVAREQLSNQLKALSNAGGLIKILGKLGLLPKEDKVMKFYDAAIANFERGKPMAINKSLPIGVKNLLGNLEKPASLPFGRELWGYNLSDHIKDVRVPLLIIIGKKDIQVDWQEDGKLLEAALKQNANTTFSYPENANHVLKHEDKPKEKLNARNGSTHYNAVGAKLDDEATTKICKWLQENSKA